MTTLENLSIINIDVNRLRALKNNARVHPKKQIEQIKRSIERYGFTLPILIDDRFKIIAGHGRAEAARQLGFKKIPCVVNSTMTEQQKRAYAIMDNKVAENAQWDHELLCENIQELLSDPKFELADIAFDASEIDGLLAGPGGDDSLADEETLPTIVGHPVSRAGDLWVLGSHKLYCGSALGQESFERLLRSEKAEMVFTDPPYNVPIDGNATGINGRGKFRHREFAMASGEMTATQFARFLQGCLGNLARYSRNGSIHYVCMDWRHLNQLLAAGEVVYGELKQLCVWVKDLGGMGSFYRSRHELVLVFKSGNAPHINTFELGQHGRYRTNVWEYRGANSPGRERQNSLALHPTVKPVLMIAEAIKDVSNRNGIVLDCFGGSGSTLIASQTVGRRARLIEIDPLYVDVTIRRWERFTKDEAILASTGETFQTVAAGRTGGASK